MEKITTITFLLLSLSGICYSENPGIKMRITDKGLETGVKYLINTMVSNNSGYQLPNMKGTVESEEMKYEFKEIEIVGFNCETITTAWMPETGVQISLQSCSSTINCTWEIESWLINDDGSSTLTLDGISVSVVMGLHQTSPGVPSLSMLHCQSGVQGIDIKMFGGVSYVYEAIKDPMENLVRTNVNQQLCAALRSKMKQWDQALRHLNLNLSLSHLIDVDMTLVGNLEISKHYADMGVKGRFSSFNQTETDFSPVAIVFPVQQESMVYVGVSESSVNSLCDAYYTAGNLNFEITDIADSQKITTSELSACFPEISKSFPNPTPVKILVSASQSPVMYLKPNNLTAQYEWLIQAFAYPSKDKQHLLSATVVALFRADFSLSEAKGVPGLNLTGSVSLIRLQLDESQSTKISKSTVTKNGVQKLMSDVIMPAFNEKITKGIYIPGSFLKKPVLSINEGFAVVAADLNVDSLGE